MYRKIVFSLVLVFLGLTAFAQTGTVRGFVYDKKTGEPVIFTSVQLKGTTNGANTDVNGFYSITKVPTGEYTISVISYQHETYEATITVSSGRILEHQIYLLEGGKTLESVEVTAEKQEAKTEVKISEITVTKKDIKSVPAIGGESDIATYFQTVPGVVSTGDQGGQLYVRGGSPIQNKVLLDGMTIYNPFHSIGFYSVFDTEIIRSADIYTGGFSAEYGGRISSVMDITTKDGNKENMAGRISVTPFGAKGLLEGPIKRAKEGKTNTISYLLSAKTSYLTQSSKIFYPYAGRDSLDTNGDGFFDKDTLIGLPFNFTDIYGKITFAGPTGSKFNLFGFNFNDRVSYQGISNLAWNSFGAGSNFILLPSGSPVLITGKLTYSKYVLALQEKDLPERRSSIDGFNLGFDFKYFIKDDEIKYGIELLGFTTDFLFNNASGRTIQQKQNTTEFSAYVDYKLVRGLLVLEPSFRLQYYASLGNVSPEPRLGAKYNVTENFRVKFAGGFYSQNFIAANSDRDVVNLFYGFLSGPDNLQQTITDEEGNERDRTHSLQKSEHAIAGFEFDLTRRLSLNVEAYYKNFSQLTNINRNKIFDVSDSDAPELLKLDYIIETGAARGVDVLFKYNSKKLYVWAGYSLGKVDRWDGFQTYSPVFDRRHNTNFVVTYEFGKDWEFDARWNFGSGLPFTPRAGYYHNITFDNGINTDITTVNSSQLETILGDLNSSRLPTYHRLDVTIKKNIDFKNSKLEINVGATNVYNRQNIFYVIPEKNESIYQLPFLPSFGIAWSF
ncbi:MAG: TonB-dependent receptor [Bacteroidia bacterium]